MTEFISVKKTFKNLIEAEEIHDIKKMISSFINNFKKQKENGTISKKQLSFYESLEKLEKSLKEAKIYHIAGEIHTITFWRFLDCYIYESMLLI